MISIQRLDDAVTALERIATALEEIAGTLRRERPAVTGTQAARDTAASHVAERG